VVINYRTMCSIIYIRRRAKVVVAHSSCAGVRDLPPAISVSSVRSWRGDTTGADVRGDTPAASRRRKPTRAIAGLYVDTCMDDM
jgi:hypothetical protein